MEFYEIVKNDGKHSFPVGAKVTIHQRLDHLVEVTDGKLYQWVIQEEIRAIR